MSKRDVRTSSDGRNMGRFALGKTLEMALPYQCHDIIFSEDMVKITGIRKNIVISLYKERS